MAKWLKYLDSLPRDKDGETDERRIRALYFSYDPSRPTEQEFKRLSTMPLAQLEEKCWNSILNYKLGDALMREMVKRVPNSVLYERPGFCSLYMLEQIGKGLRPKAISEDFSQFKSVSAVDKHIKSLYPDLILSDAVSITPFYKDLAAAHTHFDELLQKLTERTLSEYEPNR